MNGELEHIFKICTAAKNALIAGADFVYVPPQYEDRTDFVFLADKKPVDAGEWFARLKSKGLTDIAALCPSAAKDRGVLGFINTSGSVLVCFFAEGKSSLFLPRWEMNPELRKWRVNYTEQAVENPPAAPLRFEDNTAEFADVLAQIAKLADKIGCGEFARIFRNALDILNGKTAPAAALPLPEANLRLFTAASAADVFGAMGSWNDSPPYMAEEKGLGAEYDRLSAALLSNLRRAAQYAVNVR